jgi:CheY-like chemotaxis protein
MRRIWLEDVAARPGRHNSGKTPAEPRAAPHVGGLRSGFNPVMMASVTPMDDDATTATERTISIVIADDHAVMRSGLKMLLETEGDLEIVAEAGDVDETIRKLKAYKPDVLLLDLHMPGGPSLQAIPEMREWSPATRMS